MSTTTSTDLAERMIDTLRAHEAELRRARVPWLGGGHPDAREG